MKRMVSVLLCLMLLILGVVLTVELTAPDEGDEQHSLPENWSVNLYTWEEAGYGQELNLTLCCEQGSVQVEKKAFPGGGIQMSVSGSGVTINHAAYMLLEDAQFLQSEYKKAYEALQALDLPRVTQENFSPTNTPQQREQAGNYFTVTVNGQPISGNLWWGQGNNHVDLQFDFDGKLHLNPGDVVEVWMGMPKQN